VLAAQEALYSATLSPLKKKLTELADCMQATEKAKIYSNVIHVAIL